jgi:PHP family Zn ribbon phosphoesterase
MEHQTKNNKPKSNNNFLGIYFKCCNVYCRIYKNRQQTAYEGYCPKCGKKVKILIGKNGTDSRFFEAY